MEEKILSSGTEAAARFPHLWIPDRFPKSSSLASLSWGVGGKQPPRHPPKSKASTPRSPHFLQRVSCGVYVTVCPLACKQKAQPKRRGTPGAARWPRRCTRPGRGPRRWGLSSRCPPPLVARGSCGFRAARRGFAGAEPCCIPSCTSPPPAALRLGVPTPCSQPAAGGQGRWDAARPPSAAVVGRGGRVQHGRALRWGRAPAPFC